MHGMYSRMTLERSDEEGESPVGEMHNMPDGTRVGPDTCNPV